VLVGFFVFCRLMGLLLSCVAPAASKERRIMRKLFITLVLGFLPSMAFATPCTNIAHRLREPMEMLTCEPVLSTPESNLDYTLKALERAATACDTVACYDLVRGAKRLFKKRMGLLLLKAAAQEVAQTDGLPQMKCPSTEALCVSVAWKR
jgi:hypothetical protein